MSNDSNTVSEGSSVQAPVVSNNVYDKLKSFVQVVAPAMITFYLFAGHAYGWVNVELHAGVASAFLVLLGVIVTWLSASFNKSDAKYDGEINIDEDPDGVKVASLVLKNYEDPADVVQQKEVLFKINP